MTTGFRNVLVHGYAEVDNQRVVARSMSSTTLEAFVDDVRQ